MNWNTTSKTECVNEVDQPWKWTLMVVSVACRGLTGGFLLLRIFSVGISASPHVCIILDLILISMFLRNQGGSSVFGSLVILDVARCYLWLFSLYINIKIGKNSC